FHRDDGRRIRWTILGAATAGDGDATRWQREARESGRRIERVGALPDLRAIRNAIAVGVENGRARTEERFGEIRDAILIRVGVVLRGRVGIETRERLGGVAEKVAVAIGVDHRELSESQILPVADGDEEGHGNRGEGARRLDHGEDAVAGDRDDLTIASVAWREHAEVLGAGRGARQIGPIRTSRDAKRDRLSDANVEDVVLGLDAKLRRFGDLRDEEIVGIGERRNAAIDAVSTAIAAGRLDDLASDVRDQWDRPRSESPERWRHVVVREKTRNERPEEERVVLAIAHLVALARPRGDELVEEVSRAVDREADVAGVERDAGKHDGGYPRRNAPAEAFGRAMVSSPAVVGVVVDRAPHPRRTVRIAGAIRETRELAVERAGAASRRRLALVVHEVLRVFAGI